jgi:hypothetical protein
VVVQDGGQTPVLELFVAGGLQGQLAKAPGLLLECGVELEEALLGEAAPLDFRLEPLDRPRRLGFAGSSSLGCAVHPVWTHVRTPSCPRPVGERGDPVGQSVKNTSRQLYSMTVPLVQTIRWDLHWVK